MTPPRLASIAGLSVLLTLIGCERSDGSRATAEREDAPDKTFRNVTAPTAYVGDSRCATCHAAATATYRRHAMASSFHPWTRDRRIETPLDTPLRHGPTGLQYAVRDSAGGLYQVEYVVGPGGKRLHELSKRIDYVMGSGHVARTYFTAENGRLFQLPLTWYRDHGWDFSPGYETNNARFDRLMPDRCIACHSSYPEPIPFLEGKYAEVRPGIGCERCHGPGALHVAERQRAARSDSGFDNSIVNPARLPLERRLDACEQCHVHTAVTVIREGRNEFSYRPSQPLRDQAAFFRVSGGIDIVSHADRLKQSACFIATRATAKPLECATCHDPHAAPPDSGTRSQSCQSCHASAVLGQRLARSDARAAHAPRANCVACHMPKVQEGAVPHARFTDHWIRVVSARSAPATSRPSNGHPIEPYYDRDRAGATASVYQGVGEVIYATQANDNRALAAAALSLERALAGDTVHDDARFFLGAAYEQLGRTDAAIPALEKSVRGDSNQPDRLRALAQAYERADREPSTIDRLYRRALTLQPALAWIRADYADFLHSQDRRGEAKEAYRAALLEQPSLAVARFNLGTLLFEEGRLQEASTNFAAAVHRDPALAEALSRFLEIGTTGRTIVMARGLDSPLRSLPVRDRGPRAAQMALAADGTPTIQFLNVPPGGFVQVVRPNGTLVRALRANTGSTVVWDLRTTIGAPIASGVYQARVVGRDASGRASTQTLHFGVVRQRRD